MLTLLAVLALFHEVHAACSASALAKGCVFVEGGCWCAAPGKASLMCDQASGYSGEYYSITGRSAPSNLGASPNKATALNILSALNLTAHATHCVSDAECDADCATNRLGSSTGAWGTSLTCWTNQQRWNRTDTIVRCTNFEVAAPICNAAGLAKGCVATQGGCWCKGAGIGSSTCDFPSGYSGEYYSITGRSAPSNLGSQPNKTMALAILAALNLTADSTHCVNDAECDADCATNRLVSTGSWGTSLTCWTNAQRWARTNNIVRCTSFEGGTVSTLSPTSTPTATPTAVPTPAPSAVPPSSGGACSAAALAKGCVFVEGGCWCAAPGKASLMCDQASGYSGEYYSITGRSAPSNLGASPNKATALNILSALNLTAHATHCVSDAECDADCATNRLGSSTGAWGTSLTCWTNQQRWDRSGTIVRCTNFEVRQPSGFCNAAGLAKGCVATQGGCWCKGAGIGSSTCDFPSGYSGEYYSITGRSAPSNLGSQPNKAMALAILAALNLTAHSTHCVNDAECDADCATNRLGSSTGSWGTSLTCWTNAQRWARTNNIVRCTSYETGTRSPTPSPTPLPHIDGQIRLLGYNLSSVPPSSSARQTFISQFVAQLAAVLELSEVAIQVTGLRAGSIIVDFRITPGLSASAPSVADVRGSLVEQVSNPNSNLHSGSNSILASTDAAFPAVSDDTPSPSRNDGVAPSMVGGVVAAVAFVVLAVVAGVWAHRRKKLCFGTKRRQALGLNGGFPSGLVPPSASHAGPVSTGVVPAMHRLSVLELEPGPAAAPGVAGEADVPISAAPPPYDSVSTLELGDGGSVAAGAPQQNLRPGWRMFHNDAGIPYYFNELTGQTTWVPPS